MKVALVILTIILNVFLSSGQVAIVKKYDILVDNKEVESVKVGEKFEFRINLSGRVYSKRYKIKLDIPKDIILISGKSIGKYSSNEREQVFRFLVPKEYDKDEIYLKYKKKNVYGIGVWIWRFTLKYPLLIVGTVATIPVDVFMGFTILPDIFPAYKFHTRRIKKNLYIPVKK